MNRNKSEGKIMALVRLAPFSELEGLHQEMNRLFDSLKPSAQTSAQRGFEGLAFNPLAELRDMPEHIELKLELPGLEAKDLDIQVTSKSVSISGERRSQSETQENGVTRSEFRYGQFSRVLPLPARVINDQTKAEYKDGVLTLTLPKAEGDKQATFKVEVN
jgi:HSP20 family protein